MLGRIDADGRPASRRDVRISRVGRVDVVLEEYKSLRAEILGHLQAQTTLVSVALTATAAIAAIAFGAKTGDPQRLEILLALPLVLNGLGLAYLTHGHGSAVIGRYIETRLWPSLQAAGPDDDNGVTPVVWSWEKLVAEDRSVLRGITSVKGWLSFLPGLVIFGAPSVAALIINWDYRWQPIATHAGAGLEWAWFMGTFVTLVSLVLLILAGHRPAAAGPPGGSTTLVADATQLAVSLQLPDGAIASGTLTLQPSHRADETTEASGRAMRGEGPQ